MPNRSSGFARPAALWTTTVITLALVVFSFAIWHWDTPLLDDSPVNNVREDGAVNAASGAGVQRAVFVPEAPIIPDRYRPLLDATVGGICVTVTDVGGRLVSGVAVELLRVDGARKWLDPDSVPSHRSDSRQAVCISSARGECLFGALAPEGTYFLYTAEERLSFFRAQASPLRRRAQSSGRGRVTLDKSFNMRARAMNRLSGNIPVTANTVTKTELVIVDGCSVAGEVFGEWDAIKVQLNRKYRSVRSIVGEEGTHKFLFEKIAPIGIHDICFHGIRGNDHFFGKEKLDLVDGQSHYVPLYAWDPDSVISLALEAPQGETPPPVHLKLLREAAPQLLCDIFVTPACSVQVHGLYGARIMSLSIDGPANGWGLPELGDVSGLVQGVIQGPKHTIRMRRQ